jgi:hypothetical protein
MVPPFEIPWTLPFVGHVAVSVSISITITVSHLITKASNISSVVDRSFGTPWTLTTSFTAPLLHSSLRTASLLSA